MNTRDFKAMVSLLDDNDEEIVKIIEDKFRALGTSIVPELRNEMKFYREKESVLTRIEALIESIDGDTLENKFLNWFKGGGVNLFDGLFLTTLIQNPNEKLEDLKREFNKIYLEVWTKTRTDINPVDLIEVINEVVFEDLGYEPNLKNFHAAENTLFNEVLKQRKGNPVCLSCIYILIAEKLGVPIYGVNFPNLFILIYDNHPYTFYLNVFNKGQIFMKRDIEQYLKSMELEYRETYFTSCSNIDIIKRILNNLLFAYKKTGELNQLEKVRQIINLIR